MNAENGRSCRAPLKLKEICRIIGVAVTFLRRLSQPTRPASGAWNTPGAGQSQTRGGRRKVTVMPTAQPTLSLKKAKSDPTDILSRPDATAKVAELVAVLPEEAR